MDIEELSSELERYRLKKRNAIPFYGTIEYVMRIKKLDKEENLDPTGWLQLSRFKTNNVMVLAGYNITLASLAVVGRMIKEFL